MHLSLPAPALIPLLSAVALCGCFGMSAEVSASETAFVEDIRPLLDRFCIDCHGAEAPEGDLNLAAFRSQRDVLDQRRQWKRIWEVVRDHEMPPQEHRQPSDAQRQVIVDWVFAMLRQPDPTGRRDPGRVALRRLNAVEYNNTLFDLFRIHRGGSYLDPAKGMPDEVRLVPHRMQRPRLVELPPDDVGYGYDNIGEVLSLPPFLMEKYFHAAKSVVEQAAGANGGKRSPLFTRSGVSPSDVEAARRAIADFVPRAFRRPVDDQQLQPYLDLFALAQQNGESFEDALKVAIQAVLVSPQFLFRVENGIAAEEQHGVRPLSDHELAARMSYFLWSSMPDDELFELADAGQLRSADTIERQTRRMLRSPKIKELSENFVPQWLGISTIEGAMPDMDTYPEFFRMKYLPTAMKQEALLLFETVLVEDRSVLDLVDPDFIWLNGTLQIFYGIDEESGRQKNASLFWHRYPLQDKRRGGVLTMGAPLLATSNATRTNPVKRGKWVLETLLGAPPPPPPPTVPNLDETPVAEGGVSLRKKLELHRTDAACASCHARLDPLGFSLENYDGIGAWRDSDGATPIDATGQLIDGTAIDGPLALKEMLVTTRRRDFVRCFTEQLLTYALGRPLDYYDAVTVEQIVDRVAEDDYRLQRLLVEITCSFPFRHLPAADQ